MPKIADVLDTKPKGKVKDDLPTNSQVLDTKPKGIINLPEIEEYETVQRVIRVGDWMGSPFITYTVAQTLDVVRAKGG